MKLNNKKLDNIYGGNTSLPSTILKYFTDVIKVVLDAGKGLGSSIRRIKEDNICPVD